MKYLDDIKKNIVKNSTDEDRMVVGVWAVDCLFNPPMNGRVFKYKFIIVQTEKGLGCAYSEYIDYDISNLENLVGKDCLSCNIQDYALQVAAIDSVMPYYKDFYFENEVEKIEGSASEKLRKRTDIIIREARRLIGI